ncbi:hypothetical protein MWU59_05545 [Flavobacteriaceae bacterium F08102]|nr:hypothetical protein [Flavobacteriaceae bacterium F08102]
MKLFKSLLSITLIVLFFTNCKQKVDSESYVVKKDYFEDGKLKSVYFGDTLKIGKAYYFNNKGEKFTDINFYGSKFNGKKDPLVVSL